MFMPVFEPAANLVNDDAKQRSIANQKQAWENKRALDPLTAQICAVGVLMESAGETVVPFTVMDAQGTKETMLIETVWKAFYDSPSSTTLVGHTIRNFDLPMLILRSIKLGIKVPLMLSQLGQYDQTIFDIAEVWNCKRYPKAYCSLGNMGLFFGVGSKAMKGDMFYETLQTDPEAAREYLENDLVLTYEIYKKMDSALLSVKF
jgi:hypothetical protein